MIKKTTMTSVLASILVLGFVQNILATDTPCSVVVSAPCHDYRYVPISNCNGNGQISSITDGAGDQNINICTGSGSQNCSTAGTVFCTYTVTTTDCWGVSTGVLQTNTPFTYTCQ